jgi:6-phosphogluconolactonase
MSLQIDVVDDPARVCATILANAAGGHIVLAGGSTPKAAYEEFAGLETGAADLGRTTLWFGDERCVPAGDEHSNFRMVKETLLDSLVGSPQPTVRRIRGELGPAEAAEDYERQLRDAGTPRFDLVLLGLGPDGHTASLFPDQPSLSEHSRLAVGVPEAGLQPFVARVTLTLPALASARRVVFLAAGAAKADAVARAFGPPAKPDPHVPASLLVPLANEITVLIDRAAAGGLGAAER